MRGAARMCAALSLLAAMTIGAEEKATAPSFFPTQEKPAPRPKGEKSAAKPKKDEPLPALTVDEALEKLDLRGRVAQLMLVTLSGEVTPNVEDVNFLHNYLPGGVMVRQAALPTLAQMYVERVHGAGLARGIPVLVGTDLYSLARADRGLASQFVELPSLLSLAAARDSGATEHFAHLLAEHLRGMGFDFSLGPSLELAPVIHGAKPTIYTFGSSPEFAAETGVTVIEALTEAGIVAAPTGFPGGGANRKPKEPAVLMTQRADLAQGDVLPYARAIAAGVEAIHVGNTLVPTLDNSGAPASLSHDVIQQYLRDEMKFDGLVIAGPLDVEDVTLKFDAAEAAQRSLLAGADLLYFVTPLNAVARVVDKLTAAVEHGDLPRETVDRAARRVLAFKIARALKMKEMTGGKKTELPAPDAEGPGESKGAHNKHKAESASEKSAKKLEGQKALEGEAYAVERKAITLIKNTGDVLPLAKDRSTPLGVTGVVGTDVLKDLLKKPLKTVAEQPIGTARHLGEIQDFEIDRLTKHSEGLKTAIVILTDDLRPIGQKKLIRGLKANGAKVVVVLLGYPGNAVELLDADAIILAYCDNATYGETIKAVADVLLGKPAITLRNDLGAMTVKAGESRHFNALDIVRAPAGRLPVALGDGFPEGFSINYGGDALAKNAEWDFGDGFVDKGLQVDYTYAKPGEYTLKVKVHAAEDEEAQQSFHVTVTP